MVKKRSWLFSSLALVLILTVACTRLNSTPEKPTPTALRLPTDTAQATQSMPVPTASPRPTITPVPTLEAVKTKPTPKATQELEATKAPADPTPEPTVETEPAADLKIESSAVPPTHTVSAGENLFRIGLEYEMGWQDLANINHLDNPNLIFADQVLFVAMPSQAFQASLPITHTVRPGETLYRIGLAYGSGWEPIARHNHIFNANRIYAGQELLIPAGETVASSALPTAHVVQSGENLFRIGLFYGVPWTEIARVNNILNPNRVMVGTELSIPAPQGG